MIIKLSIEPSEAASRYSQPLVLTSAPSSVSRSDVEKAKTPRARDAKSAVFYFERGPVGAKDTKLRVMYKETGQR